MANETKFFIIVTGHNCAELLWETVGSLQSLNYDNWEAVLINDGSEDFGELEKALNKIHHPKIKVENYSENKFAAYRRHEAIKKAKLKDDTAICFLGLDGDQLTKDSLRILNEAFKTGKYLMSYGQWIGTKGGVNKVGLDFEDEVHENRSYRKVQYRSTALNVITYGVYKNIRESDFVLQSGEWIKTATEAPVLFAALEMSGKDRIHIQRDWIYVYEDKYKSLTRWGKKVKYDIYFEICRLKKYDLI